MHNLRLPHYLSLFLPTYVFLIFTKQHLVFPSYIGERQNKQYFLLFHYTLYWQFRIMLQLMYPNSNTHFLSSFSECQYLTLLPQNETDQFWPQTKASEKEDANLYQAVLLASWQSWKQQRHRDHHIQKTPCHFLFALD